MAKTIVAINASPRRNWNTDSLINKAIEGAKSEGAEVVKFDLFRLEKFTGCMSCFKCKKKGYEGFCILKDGLRPVINAILQSDGVIIGAPIYFGDLCAQFKLLYERLLFPFLTYNTDRISCNKRPIPVLLITTCNARQDYYRDLMDKYKKEFDRFVGPTETMIASETLQVRDYSVYDWNMFDADQRIERHEKAFPLDLQRAYDLGVKQFKA
jgi:multimeric flavodoxin WrbA